MTVATIWHVSACSRKTIMSGDHIIMSVSIDNLDRLSPAMKRGFKIFIKSQDLIDEKLKWLSESQKNEVIARSNEKEIEKIIEATEEQYRNLKTAKGNETNILISRIKEGLQYYRKKLFEGIE
jgi:hypothetical protein